MHLLPEQVHLTCVQHACRTGALPHEVDRSISHEPRDVNHPSNRVATLRLRDAGYIIKPAYFSIDRHLLRTR